MLTVPKNLGQATVEFALVVPVILLIIWGVIEFSRILYVLSEVTNASREAARYGSSTGLGGGGTPHYLDCDEIRNAARERAALTTFDDGDIAISYDNDAGGPPGEMGIFADCGDPGLDVESVELGDRIVVTVTKTIRPLISVLPIPDLPITSVTARTILKDIEQGAPECIDGIDNDLDGAIDFPLDSGCDSPADTLEAFCYPLTMEISPPDSGTVAVSPDPNCVGKYIEETVVTLNADPSPGFAFKEWDITPGGIDSGNPISLTMDITKTVVANFQEVEADVRIASKVGEPDPVGVGQPLQYTIEVGNDGPNPATIVMLEDPLPSGVNFVNAMPSQGSCSESGGQVSCDLGSINNGSSATVIINVDAPLSTGTITNTATVVANEPDPEPGDNQGLASTQVIALSADLSITKSDSNDPVVVNGLLNYSLQIRNNGPTGATGVTVTDTLPPDVTFVSASAGCSESSGIVTCTIGGLSKDANAFITIEVTAPPSPGTITNNVQVAATEPDSVSGNNNDSENTLIVDNPADLSVEVEDIPDPVGINEPLSYEGTVENHGPPGATGVIFESILPLGVTSVSATSSQGSCTEIGGTVTCPLGNLAAGATATVTISVTAPNVPGTIINRASVSGNEPDLITSNDRDNDSTRVLGDTDLSVFKSDSFDPVQEGDEIIYTLTVVNNGPSDTFGVKMVDTLPANTSFVSAPGCSRSGNTVTCNRGLVRSGDSETSTITVIPTESGILVNQVVVSGDQSDPDMSNNSASESTQVEEGTPTLVVSPNCDDPNASIVVNGINWLNRTETLNIYWDYYGGDPDPTQVLLSQSDYTVNGNNWSETVTIPGTASSNVHSIRAEHGSTALFDYIEVPCPEPNLIISQPELIGGTPIQNEPVSFEVTVTNNGNVDVTNPFSVGLYFDPSPAPASGSTHISGSFKKGEATVNGLSVGESQVIVLTAGGGFGSDSLHSVYVVVDSDPSPTGNIVETNEEDNISGSLQVLVDAGPPGSLIGQVFLTTGAGTSLQPGAEVKAIDADTGIFVDSTFSDSNGIFNFSALGPRTYTLTGCINIGVTEFSYSVTGVQVNTGSTTIEDIFLVEGPCS